MNSIVETSKLLELKNTINEDYDCYDNQDCDTNITDSHKSIYLRFVTCIKMKYIELKKSIYYYVLMFIGFFLRRILKIYCYMFPISNIVLITKCENKNVLLQFLIFKIINRFNSYSDKLLKIMNLELSDDSKMAICINKYNDKKYIILDGTSNELYKDSYNVKNGELQNSKIYKNITFKSLLNNDYLRLEKSKNDKYRLTQFYLESRNNKFDILPYYHKYMYVANHDNHSIKNITQYELNLFNDTEEFNIEIEVFRIKDKKLSKHSFNYDENCGVNIHEIFNLLNT